ncbi:MAG: DNA-protecting protein DprA [Candidatus Abyssobacteria bacterium SURF_17]|jgi:DNA processing protein|uniref:DNA-protecting protein DprA n=1 Tax=Candidatus Abyssobacteria bacterium SURF_17 TaxID=2093361 RepID=A0A419F7N5_9BACT|nr:MAG: DNA-protecting protein DprA [Candidatus Abyssubacteria bacterium SURF_17]
MDEVRDWVELSLIPGVGPKTFFKLVHHFGGPRSALDASKAALREVPDLTASVIESIRTGCASELAKAIDLTRKHGVAVLTFNSDSYPERLKNIHDPPPILYVKGTLHASDVNAVSIVGTRRATHYGKMVAERLAADLARLGLTVVSGLAHGIDAAAHKGSLAAGGRTLAVLGCGVDVVYPRANAKIYEQIARSGALLSEFPMGCEPDPGFFPLRNRIVSGLSLGTLVVEAPNRSGALITARHALEQGREVFAVPGNIYSPYSEGCHKLIKDGAKLVENVYDIISEIERNLEGVTCEEEKQVEPDASANVPMSAEEKKVFNFLSMVPVHIDDIGEGCNLSASQTASILMQLELKGLIRQLSGKHFIRRV